MNSGWPQPRYRYVLFLVKGRLTHAQDLELYSTFMRDTVSLTLIKKQ
jgi:hypothetical protein